MADPVAGGLEVAKCLFAPCLDAFRRHCSYVTSYDDYVGELEHQAEKLEQQRKTIQDSMDDAENHGKPIKTDFKDWAEKAKADAYEARRVLDDNATATRFHGWLLNPKKRHGLGKDGKTIADRIKKLLELIPPGEVYDDPPSALVDGGLPMISSALDTIGQSRDSILRNIMSALDDDKNKVIGIHGPGGVGKTTLLETVEKKLRIEKRPFHMIAKAEVSRAPDLKQIQVDIASCFKLNLMDEPHEDRRRDLLLRRLQKDPSKRVLVILDDLWKELDLRAVGIPSGDESSGCQVLLVSRDEDVLQKTGASLRFRLEGLSYEEAFRLFEKEYGPDELKDEGYEEKADQVVAKLAGLPLLIKSVAGTLKCGDESTWDTALIKIKDPNIKSIVEWSYDLLGAEETKALFLLCGFIGGSIRVELLLGLGMGLGLFEEFDKEIRSSRNELNEMLRRLRSICLLQDGGDDKESVTIHDLYNEAVISTPLAGQNSFRIHRKPGSWPKEKLGKCWVYLVNVGNDRLAELRLHWFPNLEIFLLSEQRKKRDCHGLDFASMKELRVLYFRYIDFTSFRSSVEILENLQSLYLDNCIVEGVAILGELKALQILSFAGSSISSLPKEIGKLKKLKLLNLTKCRRLEKIEPGVLEGLTNLEELHMRGSFDKWMGEDEISSELCNAKLAELKSLRKLSTLEISIPNPTVLLEDGDLPLGNLNRFCINIGKANKGKFEGLTAMMLDLKGCDKGKFEGLTTMMLDLEGCDSILSKEWVQKTLEKTQYLHLDGLREFKKKSANELCSQGFPKLKHLHIRNCYSIEHIVSSSNGAFPQLKHLDIQNCSSIKHIVSSSNGVFPLLESLSLENLGNLEKICDGPECFSKLKAMRVIECDRLEYIWCLSQKHRLAQLEEIEVRRCKSMRAIAIDDARECIVVADNRVELPNLRRLELFKLPNMLSFCIEAEVTSHGAPPIQVWFPRLESLVMEEPLNWEKILYDRPPLEYSKLKSIVIRESKSTSLSILKSDWILTWTNLESLKIESSPSVEVVFDLEELKGTGHVEILSRLTELRLSKLPNLQRMCKENAQLKGISVFRNLKELQVNDTGLAFLFPISVAKCLRGITEITVFECENMEALVVDEDGRDEGTNDIIEFPELKYLCIRNCPVMKSFSYFHGKKESVPITLDSRDAYSDSFFDPKVTFPSLNKVEIGGVRVKELWSNQTRDDSFCKLRILELMECENLQRIAPSHVWKRLRRSLKILKVKSCRLIEIIDEGDATVAETGPLRSLVLHDLKNLRHIWRYDSLPNINVPFPNLMDIEVVRCPRLRMLFESFTASFLGQIKWLEVESCEDMELIADHGECEGATCTTITFSKLDALKLKELPKFRGTYLRNTMWNSHPTCEPLLECTVGKSQTNLTVLGDGSGKKIDTRKDTHMC